MYACKIRTFTHAFICMHDECMSQCTYVCMVSWGHQLNGLLLCLFLLSPFASHQRENGGSLVCGFVATPRNFGLGMGCGNSRATAPEPIRETAGAETKDISKVDKLKFRQPTVLDLLGEERAELDAKLTRWGLNVFDALVDQKGCSTGTDLASALKKLPPTKSPTLAPVSCFCHPCVL